MYLGVSTLYKDSVYFWSRLPMPDTLLGTTKIVCKAFLFPNLTYLLYHIFNVLQIRYRWQEPKDSNPDRMVLEKPAVVKSFTPGAVDVERTGGIIPAPAGFERELSALAVTKISGPFKAPENFTETDPFDPRTFPGRQIKMTYGTDKNPQISGVKSKIIFHFYRVFYYCKKMFQKCNCKLYFIDV